jgi:hypothetical protein
MPPCSGARSYIFIWFPTPSDFNKNHEKSVQNSRLVHRRKLLLHQGFHMLSPSPCSLDIFTKSASMSRSILSNSNRCIRKALKEAQKKVWPTFPLQIGMFSLLDFSHSKVEDESLEDVKLVDIELKGMTHTKSWKTTWPNTT